LNTGRIRDQWHTMTRTGLSANLTTHRAEPFCEIHPNDALKFGIRDKALVEVVRMGQLCIACHLAQGVRRGQIFAPIHWTEQVASDARIGKVVNPVVDAISGEPEFKHTPVAIQPFHTTWQGVLYVREGLNNKSNLFTACAWWTKIKIAKAVRYEIADRHKF
jgi:assimilatory nitrate reductase catalytic subunit